MNTSDAVSFLPMNVDFLTEVHRIDGGLYRLYLLGEHEGKKALRISSEKPLMLEIIQEDESAAHLGFIRFIRKGDLGEEWEIDSIQRNNIRPDNSRMRELFHSCWTAARSSADYNKSDWNALRSELQELGYNI